MLAVAVVVRLGLRFVLTAVWFGGVGWILRACLWVWVV